MKIIVAREKMKTQIEWKKEREKERKRAVQGKSVRKMEEQKGRDRGV